MRKLVITLEGQPREGGYMYVTSPDLKGFRFMCEPNEDPIEAMRPVLLNFLQRYVESNINVLEPIATPSLYRRTRDDGGVWASIFRATSRLSMIAEVPA